MDCVLSFISGNKFAEKPEVSVYLETLKRVHGDKFVFTHDLNDVNRKRIESYGIKIIDVDNIEFIVRDRWRVYAEFLNSHPCERVLITDAKDVLFNSDPFECADLSTLPPGLEEYLILVSEGFTHGQSLWNLLDQTALQEMVPDAKCEKWDVINGGVQLGTYNVMYGFCDAVYRALVTLRPNCSDQAYINYMYHTQWKLKNEFVMADPYYDWFCCIGEPVARNIHGYPIDLTTWHNPKLAKPYSIVHQWERVVSIDHLRYHKVCEIA